jgi:pimeloyl-ACP methyl ester carboxylesterase
MRTLQKLVSVLAGIIAAASMVTPVHAQESIASRFAEVNGTRLRYLIAGNGDPVLLLHGYAQTSHMWLPLIPELAKAHTVIAPDLRGFGNSAKPDGGYDKKTMAQDVHALATSLGYKRVGIAGTISA